MNHDRPTFRCGPDAYAWLRAEDVLRHALAAYYALCRQQDAYVAYFPDPTLYGPQAFAEGLAEVFHTRLLAHGHALGLPGFPAGMEEHFKLQVDTSDPRIEGVSEEVSPRNQDIHRARF